MGRQKQLKEALLQQFKFISDSLNSTSLEKELNTKTLIAEIDHALIRAIVNEEATKLTKTLLLSPSHLELVQKILSDTQMILMKTEFEALREILFFKDDFIASIFLSMEKGKKQFQ